MTDTALFTIDPEKCNKDGICVAECPVKIIFQADKNSIPNPVKGADAMCIRCGHCVAVCPAAAFTHREISPDDCMEVKKEQVPDTEQAAHFLRYRRSIRTYRKKPVDRESIENLIRLASHAPSGHNTQPVFWKVIYDTEKVPEITAMVADWLRYMVKNHPEIAGPMHMEMVAAAYDMGVDVILRGAPHLVLAHGDKNLSPAQNACVIAMTYLELAAPAFGLGTCWAGFFNAAAMYWPPLMEALGLPENHVVYASAMLGYPKFRYHRMPPRKPARITWE